MGEKEEKEFKDIEFQMSAVHPGELGLRMNATSLRTLLGTVSCCYWNFATAKTIYFVLAHLILMSYHLS